MTWRMRLHYFAGRSTRSGSTTRTLCLRHCVRLTTTTCAMGTIRLSRVTPRVIPLAWKADSIPTRTSRVTQPIRTMKTDCSNGRHVVAEAAEVTASTRIWPSRCGVHVSRRPHAHGILSHFGLTPRNLRKAAGSVSASISWQGYKAGRGPSTAQQRIGSSTTTSLVRKGHNHRAMSAAMRAPGGGLRNPTGFVWHHPYNRRDQVWLVTACDHLDPFYQPLLHPSGTGGFATYYQSQ
jgi:hypothetical protein